MKREATCSETRAGHGQDIDILSCTKSVGAQQALPFKTVFFVKPDCGFVIRVYRQFQPFQTEQLSATSTAWPINAATLRWIRVFAQSHYRSAQHRQDSRRRQEANPLALFFLSVESGLRDVLSVRCKHDARSSSTFLLSCANEMRSMPAESQISSLPATPRN